MENSHYANLDPPTLKRMLDASAESILVIDECGTIQAFNRAALRNFGYESKDIFGRSISMLMPSPYAERHDAHLRNFMHTGEGRAIGIDREVVGRRKDGTTFPLHLRVGEFHAEGRRFFFGICHDTSERCELNDRILHAATHDALTGCLNRHQMMIELNCAAESNSRFALLFIDLGEFKSVNDTYGHSVGDRLLEHASQQLRRAIRSEDLLGRMGGDEFVVGLWGINDAETAVNSGRRMLAYLGKPLQVGDVNLHATASIGISLFPEHGKTIDELISHAHMAMHHIRMSTRERSYHTSPADAPPRLYLFDKQLTERFSEQRRMLMRLRQAVTDKALEVHYQLQMDVSTLEPCGMEALVRWRDGERGVVMPGEFLPLARQHGLMPCITSHVLRRAVTDNMRLVNSGLLNVPVAVNVNAECINEIGFCSTVRSVLIDAGMAASQLEIEITEDIALDFSSRSIRNASMLVNMGVGLVMDDYGVGFSSLKHLKKLRFSRLKLDRSFVSALPHSREDQSIVRTTLMMSSELSIPLVAEGVETVEQLDYLKAQGCTMAQGYFLARPMPLDELISFLSSRG